MFSKAYIIALLVAVLAGSADAGHLRHNGHSHNKRANICGTKGYDRDKGNYFYDNGGKLNSYAACSAKCLENTTCLSFAYSNKECMLFNVPLKDNFDADKGSSDMYYDRACVAPAVQPPPATTTSSSTPAAKPSSSSTSTSSIALVAQSSSSTSASSTAATVAPSSTPKSSSSSSSSTAAGTAAPSSAGGAAASSSTSTTTTTAAPDFPTANPYESKGCPMPKSIAISDLKSTIDSKTGTNTPSVKIQYGNGTFTCPGRCGSYDGQFNCVCDSDGLLNVESDGRTWIHIQEWYWCDAQEQRPAKAYASLALTLNFTSLADYVTCVKSGATTTTCTQTKPLIAPVGGYGGGGTIGFSPIDVNGKDLPNCPYRPGHSPIVTDTAACATAKAT